MQRIDVEALHKSELYVLTNVENSPPVFPLVSTFFPNHSDSCTGFPATKPGY
jgi:hypothetical protein